MKAEATNELPQANGSEPRVAFVAGSVVGVIFLFGALLFLGGLYLDRNAGGFKANVYAPYESLAELKQVAPKPGGGLDGAPIFAKNCAPCHQANGMGVAGTFPPLAGSEWVITPSPSRAIHIVLDGASGPMEVKGAQYNNAMVPWREALSDAEIAAVVTYIRSEWGNKASPATPEQVKKIRDATADHAGTPWTAADLQKVPESE